MVWNQEPIPFHVASEIGWNTAGELPHMRLPIHVAMQQDMVGAGVYGGIVKRDASGKVMVGDEWPEDNMSGAAHNPVNSTGPYLDFSKFTGGNRGYATIASIIRNSTGKGAAELEA